MAYFETIPSGAALGAEIRGINLAGRIPETVASALRMHGTNTLFCCSGIKSLMTVHYLRRPISSARRRKAVRTNISRKAVLKPAAVCSPRDPRSPSSPISMRMACRFANAGLGAARSLAFRQLLYRNAAGRQHAMLLKFPEDGGGDTSFANQYMAYETLPDVMKLTIAGKAQVHDSSRNSAGVLRPTAKLPTKPEEVEGPTHPLVRIHPDTGRQALYLGRRRV